MISGIKQATASCLVLGAFAARLCAQVFASDFLNDPVSEAWGPIQQVCDPTTWIEGGWYHQELDPDTCPGPGGGRDVYRRSVAAFDGTTEFFTEFRIQADGDRSEISFGGPALLVLGNNAGVIYHVTIARDLVKFLRDIDLPILFIQIESGVPHTYRVELSPDRYAFYIDHDLIDKGVPDGPFPAYDPRITWQGQSWYLPCHNAWDYIRYGRLPEDASGDYDSDGAATLFDYYFVHDCLIKDGPGIFGGPGENAGPGCRFTDFDRDADVDLLDIAEFANQFTGFQ